MIAFAVCVAPTHAAAAVCGTPFSAGSTPLASDALHILKAAIGGRACTFGLCDANSDCRISAADALSALKASVKLPATLECDPVCEVTIPCGDAAAPTCDGTCPAGFACTTPDGGGLEPDYRVTVCHVGTHSEDSMTVSHLSAPSLLAKGNTLGPCVGAAQIAGDDATGGLAAVDASAVAGEGSGAAPALAGTTFDAVAAPCACQPLVLNTTTTTTSTSTTNTLPTAPLDDIDNDGIPNDSDPCPAQVRNQCFGAPAIDGATSRPIRINANAAAYDCAGDRVDCNGDTWYGDFGYNVLLASAACNIIVNGEYCPIRNVAGVFGCEDEATEDLLQCEHFDRETEPELLYSFAVPNGEYVVNLLFANTYKRTRIAGARLFDVAVEGVIVLDDFDQVAAAGASRTAIVRSVRATVADGNGLQIEFGHVVENPSIKAIEVLAPLN